ncbi:hypothetical protein QBC32DRAFT_360745 [Pseudoneurospora amorphoporcata]|uniref:Uncharacterized protein n=1 Tax=Pseudoneurospora amorphoporcata TaxID=241081 RepID=A0AAN6P0Z2_9PEZI|nr:hypothetical protein QBC32DRAFT_360745 [Pseudoneurospora amorphoporcata]
MEARDQVPVHFEFHELDYYLQEPTTAVIPGIPSISRRRRLLAYAIIWSSAKKVALKAHKLFGKKLDQEAEQFDPRSLMELIVKYHVTSMFYNVEEAESVCPL